ncbi:unnamed protein product [Lactuca saligna]|uniref:Uncharacterized protein n=1 Tax=Lactuca saligna TaxID=75948 RepID=A0AA35V124_LACSI|nr:unnamed protein product [Lactuca saligna]
MVYLPWRVWIFPLLVPLSPLPGKIGVYLKTLDVGIRFPLTDFQEVVLQKDGCSLQMLTPNAVNKVVLFEMIYWANGYLPDYFVFKFFFRFCANGDKCTFSELVGSGRYRANVFADIAPKLFPHNQGVTDYLKGVQEIVLVVAVDAGENGKDGEPGGEGDRGVGAAWRIPDFSRFSSRTSKFILRFLALLSSSLLVTLSVLTATSMGSMASVPYVRLKGVSFVLVCGVVLYDHSTVGI